MRLSSPAFSDGQQIPKLYTCEDDNISPPLTFDDIPKKTQSLALVVIDPDAPQKPWIHYFVFNIPPTTTHTEEGKPPKGGTEGHANGGTPGYEGPCPPDRQHTYHFKLFALNTTLDIPPQTTYEDAKDEIEKYTIASTELTGTYPKATRRDSH